MVSTGDYYLVYMANTYETKRILDKAVVTYHQKFKDQVTG